RGESALVGGPRSPLRAVFRTPELPVYEVPAPPRIITGPGSARVRQMGESSMVATVGRPGTYRIAVRFSRYWQPSTGCVKRGQDGMIRLSLSRAGPVRLAFSPTPRRALAALAGRPAQSCAS